MMKQILTTLVFHCRRIGRLRRWFSITLALGFLAASMTDATAASPAWVDKVYSICTSPNQSMKTVSQQLANEGFVRAKFEDASTFSNLISEANILQSFNEKSNQISVEAHVVRNSNKVRSAANVLLASGVPVFWLDDSKLSALVVSRWLLADNKPVSCEIYTNDAASLTRLIERESDKRLGGGSFDNQFVISHEYFFTGPSSNAIFKIFLETVTESGKREFSNFIGETKAFMRIYQLSS
jgi:hypothetical protein